MLFRHAAQWKASSDVGLLELKPVEVNGVRIVPREVLHTLIASKIEGPPHCKDLLDYFDPATGFTAMERTTGWDGAIVDEMMARQETPSGVVPVETAVDLIKFVAEWHWFILCALSEA